jgi:MFS family permease
MAVDPRKIAVAIAGFCTFLNLYSPQALLPALAWEFGVGAAEISTIMTASTLAIALTAPFTGAGRTGARCLAVHPRIAAAADLRRYGRLYRR